MWKGVNSKDYLSLAKAFPVYIRKALDLWIDNQGNATNTDLSRSSRNRGGDAFFIGDTNIMPDGWQKSPFVSNIESDLMNYYNNLVSSRGGYFLLASPPVIEPSVEGKKK